MTHGISRRLAMMIGTASSVVWGLFPVRAFAETIRRRLPGAAQVSDRPSHVDERPGYIFFSASEAAFIEAVAGRLIPSDPTGPGAVDAGVPRFIDRQLAGAYGAGDHFYLRAPFPKGTPTQGWQMGSPAQVYRTAIPAVDRWCVQTYGESFVALDAATQDEALKALESGRAELGAALDGKSFFALLLQNTIEGYFSDPLYGGNREMGPWRMVGFPGARYDLRPFVSRYNEPYTLPPVGLAGRQA